MSIKFVCDVCGKFAKEKHVFVWRDRDVKVVMVAVDKDRHGKAKRHVCTKCLKDKIVE